MRGQWMKRGRGPTCETAGRRGRTEEAFGPSIWRRDPMHFGIRIFGGVVAGFCFLDVHATALALG